MMTSRTDISDHILRTPKEVSESSHSGCEKLTDSVFELFLLEGLELAVETLLRDGRSSLDLLEIGESHGQIKHSVVH